MEDQKLDNKHLPEQTRVVVKGNTLRGEYYEYEMTLKQLFSLNGVTNSETKQVSGNTEFTLESGELLEKILVIPEQDLESFKIGTSEGGEDIYPSQVVKANDISTGLFTINYPNGNGIKNIYLSGITSDSIIKIYKR